MPIDSTGEGPKLPGPIDLSTLTPEETAALVEDVANVSRLSKDTILANFALLGSFDIKFSQQHRDNLVAGDPILTQANSEENISAIASNPKLGSSIKTELMALMAIIIVLMGKIKESETEIDIEAGIKGLMTQVHYITKNIKDAAEREKLNQIMGAVFAGI